MAVLFPAALFRIVCVERTSDTVSLAESSVFAFYCKAVTGNCGSFQFLDMAWISHESADIYVRCKIARSDS